MASRIQPKEPTVTTTIIACMVGIIACILINSIYVGANAGYHQFVLSVLASAIVCTVGVSGLVYAAYLQFVAKVSLFSDDDRPFDYGTTGQWAVVTGATDGIGKEYARQLVTDHGMDVLLVGRNPDKLKTVAELIRKESSGRRRVMTLVADFGEDPVARGGQCCAAAGTEDWPDGDDDVGDKCYCTVGTPSSSPVRGRCTRWYPRLRALIEGPLQTDSGGKGGGSGGVGVLINCAGVCYPHPEYFAGMAGDGHDVGEGGGDVQSPPPVTFTAEYCDNAETAVKCNVAATVHACRLVLPGMLARGRGLIVNVGSASASMPPATPLMALYAATKKFLERLSADLDTECVYLTRGKNACGGVRVQCARPAYVATAMLRSANPDVRAAEDDGGGAEAGDAKDYGHQCWWSIRKKKLFDSVERWLVPSAGKWVRSALRQGGRLYAGGSASDGPANFTGYWPHTLMIWFARLASAVLPRGWYIEQVLMPGMLTYRAKGRSALVAAAQKTRRGAKRDDSDGGK